MPEIKCPNCGNLFTIDQNQYDDLIREVRNDVFEKEIQQRLNIEKEKLESSFKVQQMQSSNENQNKIRELQSQIDSLKLKRRVKGTLDWIVLLDKKVKTIYNSLNSRDGKK